MLGERKKRKTKEKRRADVAEPLRDPGFVGMRRDRIVQTTWCPAGPRGVEGPCTELMTARLCVNHPTDWAMQISLEWSVSTKYGLFEVRIVLYPHVPYLVVYLQQ